MMLKVFLLAAGLAGPVAPLSAQTDCTMEELMQGLSEISHLRMTFVEQRSSEFLTEDVELTGKIVYRSPDYMEKIVEFPFLESVLIDGDTMSVEKRKKNGKVRKKTYSLASHSALNTAVEGIRATLAGNYELLNSHYEVKLQGSCEHWALELVPRNEDTLKQVAMISVRGQDERIAQIETRESDGDQSMLTLTYQMLQ